MLSCLFPTAHWSLNHEGENLAHYIFKYIFLIVFWCRSYQSSFKYKNFASNISALVRVMLWHQKGETRELSQCQLCRHCKIGIMVTPGFIWLLVCCWLHVVMGEVQGLYSLNGKTSCHQISWCLEATRLGPIMVSSWNLTGISAELLPGSLSRVRAIGK